MPKMLVGGAELSSVWSVLINRWRPPREQQSLYPLLHPKQQQGLLETTYLLTLERNAAFVQSDGRRGRNCLSTTNQVGHHSVLGILSLVVQGTGSLCHEKHKAHPHTHQKESIHTGSVL